jgi:hypothetical protein
MSLSPSIVTQTNPLFNKKCEKDENIVNTEQKAIKKAAILVKIENQRVKKRRTAGRKCQG